MKSPARLTSLLIHCCQLARKMQSLRISGCGSSRELRQRIALERERGAIICSGSGRGYWKPKNRQEIQEFIKTMDARAWNTLKAAKGAKKALRTPEGQQSMKGDDENGEPQNVF